MDKKSNCTALCMCLGAVFGIVAGFAVGSSHGRIGIVMCYGLVLGTAIGAGIGTVINKMKH